MRWVAPPWPNSPRGSDFYRENLTAYDAAYVALAEALRCPLLTTDEQIARAPGLQTGIVQP